MTDAASSRLMTLRQSINNIKGTILVGAARSVGDRIERRLVLAEGFAGMNELF